MPEGPHNHRTRKSTVKDQGLNVALRQELLELDDIANSRFIEIGRRLRMFCESLPGGDKIRTVKELLKGSKISYRSAHCWIDIDRTYSRYEVPEERLARIGWAKLALMAKHVNSKTVEEWLAFAERHTTNELRARIRNSDPAKHHVVFKLSRTENSLLTATLVASGARHIGRRRLHDKEAALMELCRLAIEASARRVRVENDPARDDEESWHMSR